MIQKIIKYLCLFTSVTFILTSCSTADSINSVNTQKTSLGTANFIQADLDYLTSDECAGRRPGTPGNTKAGSYIIKRFQEIGLEPLDDQYAQSYDQEIASIRNGTIKLDISDKDKPLLSLQYGKDFMEKRLDSTNITIPLLAKPGSTDCAILVEDSLDVSSYYDNPHVKLILVKNSSVAFTRGGSFYKKDCIPEIILSKTAYEKLEKHIGSMIFLHADVDVQNTPQNNMVGSIKGQSDKAALIISAHFDHVGSIGKPDSSGYAVWRGALDNASGVAAMLEVARKLKEIYGSAKPLYDIIFCAFNSEEILNSPENFQETGSLYFTRSIQSRYSSVFNINLDCLGEKTDSKLYIFSNTSSDSHEMASKIADSLAKSNIEVVQDNQDMAASDHKSFGNSVWLTCLKPENDSHSFIHTTEDTLDRLDITALSHIGRSVADCAEELLPAIYFNHEGNSTHESKIVQGEKKIKLLSSEEFEERFNCKLDSFDSSQLLGINVIDRQTAPLQNPAPSTVVSDTRNILFAFKEYMVSFYTYLKDDPESMTAYKDDQHTNEFDDPSSAIQVTVEGNQYLVFTQQSGDKFIIAEYQNEERLVRVAISTSQLKKMAKTEEYEAFLKDNISRKFINDFIALLLK